MKLEDKYRPNPRLIHQLQWTPGDRNHYCFYKNELDLLNWVLEKINVYEKMEPLYMVHRSRGVWIEVRIIDVRPAKRGDLYITAEGDVNVWPSGNGKILSATRVIVEEVL